MNDIYPLLGTFTIFLNFQLYVFHNGSGREGKTVTKGRKHNFLFCPTVPCQQLGRVEGQQVETFWPWVTQFLPFHMCGEYMESPMGTIRLLEYGGWPQSSRS